MNIKPVTEAMYSKSAKKLINTKMNDQINLATKEELKMVKKRGSVAANIAMFQANIDASPLRA